MAGGTDKHIAAKGQKRTIEYARLCDGSMPAKNFYDSLPKCDQAKMLALWQRTANHGEQGLNKRKFAKEDGPFWAFKSDAADGRMIRFGCFRIDDRWILVHGFYKPAQNRWPRSDVNQCYVVQSEHNRCSESKSSGKGKVSK